MRGYFAVYKLPGAPAGSVQSSQLSDLRQPLPSQFKVYPNPSSTGIVTLQLNNAIDGKFAITVTSISGEKVFEKAFQSVKGNVILLNLSSLRSGNYIVKTNWSTKLVLAR
jgi:hypothetical protein